MSSTAEGVVLQHHGRRGLSSRSGGGGGRQRRGRGPAEKRQRTTAEAKDDAQKEKESYTFLEEADLGRLSSESKGGLKTDTPPLKAAATEKTEEDEPNSGNVTLWQRWKNARAKMKLLWKQYGLVWIGTYTVLYVGGLTGIYVIMDTGSVAWDVDTTAAIERLAESIGAQDNANVAWLTHTLKTNPNANTLLKAVVANEVLEYPRDILAIAVTPSIARALGRAPPKAKS
eukprot:g10136.t1